MEHVYNLRDGLETAFIDRNTKSNLACRPEFVWNSQKQGKRVISSIEQELLNCESSVSALPLLRQEELRPCCKRFSNWNGKGSGEKF